MFSKIAIKNVRKSIKDYTVYFLTLMLGVCIFYLFNSVGAQSAMFDIASGESTVTASLVMIIDVVSVFVSVVLAFLVIYANQFMIKRRKKELGLYLVLGMPKSKISGMLVLETALIGVLSLVAGLVLGIFLSQGMAVVTAKLFDVEIMDYHFVFSNDAFLKSIIYFGVIFIVVILFNSRSIAKCKLVDLLAAGRKNEELRLRKPGATVVLFILGIALILVSYFFVFRGGAGAIFFTFAPALAINVVGTLLFFMSIAGLLLKGVQARPKKYYKGLNMFVLRQIASKINTNFVSMTFICTMLFLTIVILSAVSSFNTMVNSETVGLAPYDISFTISEQEGGANTTVEECLPKLGIDASQSFTETYEYPYYETEVKQGQLVLPNSQYLTDEGKQVMAAVSLNAIRLSDFNALLRMAGEQPITLGENEFAVQTPSDGAVAEIEAYLANPTPVTVGGVEMTPAKGLPVQRQGLWTSNHSTSDMALIVPDAVADSLHQYLDIYVANYAGDEREMEREIAEKAQNFEDFEKNAGIVVRSATRFEVNMTNNQLTTSMIFVGIYIGLVFLIAGAAVLALQQLTEASDNKNRYDLLKELGTDKSMIDRSILKQVSLYFFIPLALAAVHSVVGIWVMNQGVLAIGYGNVILAAAAAALFIAAVYGAYFLATYFGCKSIIHAKNTP